METAESTVEIPLSTDETHNRWFAFTGQKSGNGVTGDHATEQVSTDRLPGEASQAESGTVSFDALGENRTKVTMQLRFNSRALADAGMDHDWVAQRIGMYLERFKESAGVAQRA